MSGEDLELGEPMAQFAVLNIWAMDTALAEQLKHWPCFRRGIGVDSEEGYFANHCPHCGALQEDYLLHDEPGDIFFGIVSGEPGQVNFTPLDGWIQLSGDCGFEVQGPAA